MKILIYASRHHGASQRLLDSVRNLRDSHHCDCVHYDELPFLIDALHRSRIGSRMAVLFPSNHNELARLVALKHLLFDLQIILILPNGKSQTLSHGHTLRPRFISYADSDFSDVTAVSDKLVERLAATPAANGFC
ncbi:MAG: hypothetical protein PVG41_17665 [Desulfobacteraceae bacterium]|jgi:hypothetical protein